MEALGRWLRRRRYRVDLRFLAEKQLLAWVLGLWLAWLLFFPSGRGGGEGSGSVAGGRVATTYPSSTHSSHSAASPSDDYDQLIPPAAAATAVADY